MKRTAALLAVPLLAGTMSLTACGGGNSGESKQTTSPAVSAPNSTVGTTPTQAGGATATDGASTAAAGATDCPTENTRAFAKTRFVADVGLAAGTFHRWIYKPYKAGSFQKGAKGRTLALVKAGTVAALDLKLINNARENVKADPTLCKTLSAPLGKLADSLTSLKNGVVSGDMAAIANTESLVTGLENASSQNGMKITETTDEKAVTP